MDTLQTALALVFEGCWFLSLDFTDAYYSLAVHRDYRKYLRFQFEGQLYQFTCCPNGLRTGSRLFTKVLKVPLAYLREHKGVTISGYLDDTVLLARSEEEILKAGQEAADLLQDLGYMISEEKSVITPTHVIDYLGFTINSVTMMVTMTEKKTQKVKKCVQKIMSRDNCSIRELAAIIGTLQATSPACDLASLFTKSMENCKIEELSKNEYNYDAEMRIPENVREDLRWWMHNLDKIERPIHRCNPDYVIYTDASLEGWGCHDTQTENTFGGKWGDAEKKHHINYLELKAIEFGIKSIGKIASPKHIRIKSDNMTAVCCIQKQGSTKSPNCNRLARDIWKFVIDRNMWISTEHTPGSQNELADGGSRVFRDETEWSLTDEIFKEICKILGKPEIDAFATRLNRKLEDFYAWQPDPEALAIDAFLQNWAENDLYVFPPFAVLPQKFALDGAEGIIVAPFWPTKPWFSRLVDMLTDVPILLPANKEILYLPCSSREHPLKGRLKLMACRCSGRPYKAEVFRKELLGCSRTPEGRRPIDCTRFTSGNGRNIVHSMGSIPCDLRFLRH